MSPLLPSALARRASRAISQRAVKVPTRSIMTLKDHKYSAHATARGQGRNGEVKSDDDCGLQLRLAMPRSLGGKGDGQNPEQLFAMGYAACFLSALQMVAGQTGKTDQARNAVVHAQVHLGEPADMEGFGLQVDIQVEGVDDMDLIQAGHKACPYSRALTYGAVVNVTRGKKE
ncbi:OsmC-like protein [Trametes coccinea BRFM310]|uniref:OsmC-like protein n=1 Tax=Trametes coccinea (strain BRFM310) TaxID=1353009 RepID=A0A1Y2J434_TRAC3|nr:OsmC-like protein [Trametes coccinea BRFM310]